MVGSCSKILHVGKFDTKGNLNDVFTKLLAVAECTYLLGKWKYIWTESCDDLFTRPSEYYDVIWAM